MNNRLMITAATAALIAGTGFANAQGMGGGREGGAAGGAGTQQSAPSAPAASPSAGAPSHEGPAGMKATQSEEKGGMKNQRAQEMKPGATGEKSMGEKSAQDTKQDTKQGDRAKGMSTQN